MEDPSTFWEGSSIGLSATDTRAVKRYFDMPMLKTPKDGYVFDIVAKRLCKTSRDAFMKGFIDLDEMWQNSQDAEIVKYRNFIVDKTTNETLLQKYPDPFCGRKAYLTKIPFYALLDENNAPLKDDAGKIITKLGGLKPPKEGSKGKSYSMRFGVCAFHNEAELGWTIDWLKSTTEIQMDDDGNPIIPEVDPNKAEEFRYITVGGWVNKNYAEEIEQKAADILLAYPEQQFIFAFVLADKITPAPANTKFNPSMNVDRILVM